MDRHQLLYRIIPSITSMIIMVIMVFFYLSEGSTLQSLRERLEWINYDLRLRALTLNQKVDKQSLPVVIVDVDEASLKELGHWPWSRDYLSQMIENLTNQGAVITAFDVIFAEADDQAIQQLNRYRESLHSNNDPEIAELIETPLFDEMAKALDSDSRFAETVANNEVVLSTIFNRSDFKRGELRHPIPINSQRDFTASMPTALGHISNIPQLQDAANYTGFINAYPDGDGVMRRARLLQYYEGQLYPSLSLAAAMAFLLPDEVKFNSDFLGDQRVLRSIQLFNQEISVDGAGNMLVPFVGPAYSFDYVSAADVIANRNDPSRIEGKVVLVGSSAAALSDFRATPTNALYPGVEIHANIINGIITEQVFIKPEWSHGINFLMIIVNGIILSLCLPRLGPFKQLLLTLSLCSVVYAIDYWLWLDRRFAIDSIVPLLSMLLIGIFNMGHGFIVSSLDQQHLKNMFGQYVPPQLVEQMSLEAGKISMDGDRRDMSVLFSDIRSFTSISEGLSAGDLKDWLNAYFTPITEIIFKNQGTIDKYVGDMVMAFWGAPLQDEDHAYHATKAALAMLKKTDELREDFIAAGRPAVDIGIGISSGEMNVGNMGSVYRRSYTVLGDKVNLGSRLEGLTKFYGVKLIVSAPTKEDIGDRLYFRHLDRVQVKGKAEPVDIFEPIDKNDQGLNMEELTDYHQALGLYLIGNFKLALEAFRNLEKRFEIRPVYKLYKERCKELITSPPQEWQGVFVHTSK